MMICYVYTLQQKIFFQIFHGDPGSGSVTPGHVHQGICPWEEQANFAQSSLTYTPPKKKSNFRKVAFLLGKSVKDWVSKLMEFF